MILRALVLLCFGCGPAPQAARAPAADEKVVRIMTYNINYGLVGHGPTLEAIGKGDPDVVFLQETNPGWEHAIRRRYGQVLPHQAWLHVEGGAGGMAVLSRWPITSEALKEGPGWFPALRTEVGTPIGPLEVLSVHLRPPVSDSGSFVSGYFTTGPGRLQELRAHATHLKGEAPLLVVGDFNENGTGEGIQWLTTEKRLQNALMAFDPGRDTWRWPTAIWTLEATLDHILHDPRLECLDARVINTGGSDHIPLLATFTRR